MSELTSYPVEELQQQQQEEQQFLTADGVPQMVLPEQHSRDNSKDIFNQIPNSSLKDNDPRLNSISSNQPIYQQSKKQQLRHLRQLRKDTYEGNAVMMGVVADMVAGRPVNYTPCSDLLDQRIERLSRIQSLETTIDDDEIKRAELASLRANKAMLQAAEQARTIANQRANLTKRLNHFSILLTTITLRATNDTRLRRLLPDLHRDIAEDVLTSIYEARRDAPISNRSKDSKDKEWSRSVNRASKAEASFIDRLNEIAAIAAANISKRQKKSASHSVNQVAPDIAHRMDELESDSARKRQIQLQDIEDELDIISSSYDSDDDPTSIYESSTRSVVSSLRTQLKLIRDQHAVESAYKVPTVIEPVQRQADNDTNDIEELVSDLQLNAASKSIGGASRGTQYSENEIENSYRPLSSPLPERSHEFEQIKTRPRSFNVEKFDRMIDTDDEPAQPNTSVREADVSEQDVLTPEIYENLPLQPPAISNSISYQDSPPPPPPSDSLHRISEESLLEDEATLHDVNNEVTRSVGVLSPPSEYIESRHETPKVSVPTSVALPLSPFPRNDNTSVERTRASEILEDLRETSTRSMNDREIPLPSNYTKVRSARFPDSNNSLPSRASSVPPRARALPGDGPSFPPGTAPYHRQNSTSRYPRQGSHGYMDLDPYAPHPSEIPPSYRTPSVTAGLGQTPFAYGDSASTSNQQEYYIIYGYPSERSQYSKSYTPMHAPAFNGLNASATPSRYPKNSMYPGQSTQSSSHRQSAYNPPKSPYYPTAPIPYPQETQQASSPSAAYANYGVHSSSSNPTGFSNHSAYPAGMSNVYGSPHTNGVHASRTSQPYRAPGSMYNTQPYSPTYGMPYDSRAHPSLHPNHPRPGMRQNSKLYESPITQGLYKNNIETKASYEFNKRPNEQFSRPYPDNTRATNSFDMTAAYGRSAMGVPPYSVNGMSGGRENRNS